MFPTNFRSRFQRSFRGQPQAFSFNRQPQPKFQPQLFGAANAMRNGSEMTSPMNGNAGMAPATVTSSAPAGLPSNPQTTPQFSKGTAPKGPQAVGQPSAIGSPSLQGGPALGQQDLSIYEPGSVRFINRENVNELAPEFGDAEFNRRIAGYDPALQQQLIAERNKVLAQGWTTGKLANEGQIGISSLNPTYGSQQQGPGMEVAGAYQTQPFGAGLSGALAGSFGFQKPGLDATGQNPQVAGQYGFGGASGAYSGAMPMNYGGLL